MTLLWPPEHNPHYYPSPSDPYWNRDIETMDPQERSEKIILPKLRAQLTHAYEKAPLYRAKWNKAGVHPQNIRSLSDFERIPFLYKEEIREDQAETSSLSAVIAVFPSLIFNGFMAPPEPPVVQRPSVSAGET